jgi:hypothetical protein
MTSRAPIAAGAERAAWRAAARGSDAAYLESIDDDYRVYAFPQNGDASEVRRIRKALIDGHWSLEESPDVDAQAAA